MGYRSKTPEIDAAGLSPLGGSRDTQTVEKVAQRRFFVSAVLRLPAPPYPFRPLCPPRSHRPSHASSVPALRPAVAPTRRPAPPQPSFPMPAPLPKRASRPVITTSTPT